MSGRRRRGYAGILDEAQLQFRDNAELERYYEEKYRGGGYEAGCVRFGINISELYHAERHRAAFRAMAPQPGQVLLDAGCGTGRLAAQLAASGAQVHAVDIAGNAFDPRHAAIPNLHFQKMNLERLDFPDGTFEQIVCVEALEHVLDPHRVLAEFRRTLKAGGRLVLSYPTVNRTAMQRLHRALRIGRPIGISEHLNEWSFAELREHVTAAGFRLRTAEGIVFDLGLLNGLKAVSRSFALGLTKFALKLRRFPGNSLFVSAVFEKVG